MPECSAGFYKSLHNSNDGSTNNNVNSTLTKPIKANPFDYKKELSITNEKPMRKIIHAESNMQNHPSDKDFLILPNPVKDILTIRVISNEFEFNRVIIRNNPGQVVFQMQVHGNSFTVPVLSLAEGHYFIEVENESGRMVKPFLVSR